MIKKGKFVSIDIADSSINMMRENGKISVIIGNGESYEIEIEDLNNIISALDNLTVE